VPAETNSPSDEEPPIGSAALPELAHNLALNDHAGR
jgi:hypothetical protein